MSEKASLAQFAHQKTVLLTTYRRDRRPIATPVNIAVEGDRAFVPTFDTAWKLKRIRNDPKVEIAPSTMRGKPTGRAVPARARVMSAGEAEHASRALARKHPFVHGFLVPLVHRWRNHKTQYIELTPAAE